ncbi:hypothetical protein GCM10010246_29290 [Streptomyces cuspidosporus]|uniref:Uncharacterized protein n=1 Tax=Streptomyces cuspidosporus TaxID=66882 RepID=A0ABN3G1B8_9ACTN
MPLRIIRSKFSFGRVMSCQNSAPPKVRPGSGCRWGSAPRDVKSSLTLRTPGCRFRTCESAVEPLRPVPTTNVRGRVLMGPPPVLARRGVRRRGGGRARAAGQRSVKAQVRPGRKGVDGGNTTAIMET